MDKKSGAADKEISTVVSDGMKTLHSARWARVRDSGTFEEPDMAQWVQGALSLPNPEGLTGRNDRIKDYQTAVKTGENPDVLPKIPIFIDGLDEISTFQEKLKERLEEQFKKQFKKQFEEQFEEQFINTNEAIATAEMDFLKRENISLKTAIGRYQEDRILPRDSKLANASEDLLAKENIELKTIIENLGNQIHELQELLSEKYASKKLLMVCITASIALAFNLVTWSGFGIYFVHPILTIIGLIGTVGFGCLAFWRGKCQSSQA
jgi:hypothetical protein